MNWHERNELARQALSAAKFVTASGHARTNCPFCEAVVGKVDKKQCLGISVRSGFYKCWRCHTKGKLDGKEFDIPAVEKPVEKAPMQAPEGFYELGRGPGATAISFSEAREYLHHRGLTDPAVWAEARIGATLKGRCSNRVVVPVTSPEGAWWGWVARSWLKGVDRPYLNAPGMTVGSDGHFFNHAALLQPSERPVLVMEGVFDALHYWPHAVAVLGKPTEEQVHELAVCPRPVVVALDGDAWREGWALAMRLRLEGQQAGAVRLPPGADPDEVEPGWLWEEAEASLEAQDRSVPWRSRLR